MLAAAVQIEAGCFDGLWIGRERYLYRYVLTWGYNHDLTSPPPADCYEITAEAVAVLACLGPCLAPASV